MKKIICLAGAILFIADHSFSQSVGIGTTTPNSSAILEIKSSDKGLLIPRTSSTTRVTIPAVKGLMVFDTTTASFWFSNGTDWEEVISGFAGWRTNGNAGTSPATNFIGTSDNFDVVLKRNNVRAGLLNTSSTALGVGALNTSSTGLSNTAVGVSTLAVNTSGERNTAIGRNALDANTSGSGNVAVGRNALGQNTTGFANTAVGDGTLGNTTGNWNTAIGSSAMGLTSSGSNNTAIGADVLGLNTAGYNNTAIGKAAMFGNTNGNNNVATGDSALFSNTTGINNAAFGTTALFSNTVGFLNVAIGRRALHDNTNGDNNVAIGVSALQSSDGVNHNVAIGYSALSNNTFGSNNTAVGSMSYGIATTYSNSTALGYSTNITASNQVRLGNSAITSIGGFENWTNVSDSRFKTNITESVPGISFIMKLKPVAYHLNMNAIADFLKTPGELRSKQAEAEKTKTWQTGFIAQDVEQAAKALNYEFSGIDKPKNENDFYGLRYAEFVVPLVKAVQEQQGLIKDQQRQIDELKALVNTLQKK